MHDSWNGFITQLLVLLFLGCLVQNASKAGQGTLGAPPLSLQRKVQCVQAQVQKWQQEGKDPQPIVDIMQGIPRLIDEQKFAKAEKLVDRALEVAGEACPDAATSPAEVPPSAQAGPPRSLQQKVDCFQAIVEKWQQEGKDPQPLGDIMRDFPALMEQGKLAEAERVVDRALKASGEACRDQGAGQRLSAETNIANQTSPPSTPTSTAAIDPSSSGGGLGRRTFLISAMLPPPKGFDLPMAEDLLTQNGANFFMFSQDWDKIEPSSGHYDLTNTITNPFTLLIPKYRFKGVTLVLKMIDTNNRTMPADLKNKPFDDPQVEQRFLKMLHMVATAPGVASHVNYILLGNEVDSYFDAHPGELAGFMSLLKASIDQLHQDLPGVKVGTITTFSTLRHPELFRTLTQYSDFIDYTYYPLAAHWRMRPVSDVPGDLAKMSAAAGNKQFGFTEIGYSASPLSGSSDQQQADFMKTVFQTLDTFGKQVAFVDWASLGDTPPDLCEAYAKSQGLHDVDAMCAYGEHTGLRTYDNQPRPAWNIFVQAMKASGQSQ